MKPFLIIGIVCCIGFPALAQQKINDADIKSLKQQATLLMHQADSLRKKAGQMVMEVEKAGISLSGATLELRSARISGVTPKGKIDSLTQKVAFLAELKKLTEMKFDSVLVLLDSCVGRLNATTDKLDALKKH